MRTASEVTLSSMAATVHIVPQQTRLEPPPGCESSEGAAMPGRVTAHTVASSLDKEAAADICRTTCSEDDAL